MLAGLTFPVEGVEGGRTGSYAGAQVQVAHQADTLIVVIQLSSNRAWLNTVAAAGGFILVEALLTLGQTPASGTAFATEGAGGCCSVVELASIAALHAPAVHLDQLVSTHIAQIHGSTAAITTGITFQAGEASVQVVQRALGHTVPVEGLEIIRTSQTVGGRP